MKVRVLRAIEPGEEASDLEVRVAGLLVFKDSKVYRL